MLLKKGKMLNIDQRHYFREVIFTELEWEFDTRPNKSHLERTSTSFEIIIKGITYGIFKLRLSHNSKTDTRAYEQRNSMTQIHWGPIKKYIAKKDLLNCIFRLYKPITKTGIFMSL